MNERIQELALLSNIEFTYDPTETPPKAFAECWEDELEKFAESIVRECAHIAWLNSTQDNISHIKIKEHFGVN
jgi:hypothetical protein